MTGGSQDEARVSVPPRLGGLSLAGIQSGYGTGAADAWLRPPPATSAATPAVPQPTCPRNSRRFNRLRSKIRSWVSVSILALLHCERHVHRGRTLVLRPGVWATLPYGIVEVKYNPGATTLNLLSAGASPAAPASRRCSIRARRSPCPRRRRRA